MNYNDFLIEQGVKISRGDFNLWFYLIALLIVAGIGLILWYL